MASLLERLQKTSTLEYADSLLASRIVRTKDVVTTPVPGLNIALSGSVWGGLTPGLTIFAGPSKHFKSMYSLICAAAYMKKHQDAVCIFYDNEFGSPAAYFESAGIDPARVLHSPISNWEDLIHDASTQLQNISRGDRVVIVVDSIGNLASRKEIEDAIEGKEVADMTRAKRAKSFFRIVTPQLTMKDIPMIVIAHTYETLEMFSKQVVSGGTGAMYSADNVFIVGRQQEKEGTGAKASLEGYNFILNVEKSRFVKEKSKIPITVKFKGGIQKWSGLFDIAMSVGLIEKVVGTKSDHRVVNNDNLGVFSRKSAENSSEFWKNVFEETDFADRVETRFKVASGNLITEDSTESADEADNDAE